MKSSISQNKTWGRRTFLRGTLALTATTLGLAMSAQSKPLSPKSTPTEKSGRPSKGYQATAHVRTYYEKVRF